MCALVVLTTASVSVVSVQCLHVHGEGDGWQGGCGASHQAGAAGLHAARTEVRACDHW